LLGRLREEVQVGKLKDERHGRQTRSNAA
jgi:hypothetical protein